MKTLMPLLLLSCFTFSAEIQLKTTDFSGDFSYFQDVYDTSENKTKKNVENILKINSVSETEAQVLIETSTKNGQSCQLVGKAKLVKNQLVFKSQISPALNRGKKAECVLKISKKLAADKTSVMKVDDSEGLCRLQFCGFQAELTGDFKPKAPVEVQIKN